MHDFRVWAPKPKTVAVSTGTRQYAMERSCEGWWSVEVVEAGPGTEYGYVLDGGDPVPDPRSRYQPHGVNGPSCIVDDFFPWTDESWQAKPLSSAIIYELHTGTFTPGGTFRSMLERLDYLVELGVTHIQLMPVNEFSGDWGWGYDGAALFAPHHLYGRPEDLKLLVNACHEKGLAILLDVVYNHLGPTGNYLDRFGPYFTDAYRTPWGWAVNLDHAGSGEVRRFFIDNATMWLRDYHFDGLRIDAVHAMYDQSATHFLEELSCEVDALGGGLGRHLVLIAESDLNDPRLVRSREGAGFGLHAQWSDDFHHTIHTVLTGEREGYYEDFRALRDLAKALTNGFVYDGTYSVFRDRKHGRAPTGLSGHHLLGYSQNHDQVGNRARGERLSQLVSFGRAQIAAALVLTSPFVPMLFQGEEFAASSTFQYFTHHEDQDLGRSVSQGRRSEFAAFGWDPEDVPDPQDSATFLRSRLLWDEVDRPPHSLMLAWYKQLIALRRSEVALTNGRLDEVQVNFDEEANWFAMCRGPIQVVFNLGRETQPVPVRGEPRRLICSTTEYTLTPGSIELPSDSVAILI